MNAKNHTSFSTLKEVRDQVYLLSLGNEFLCETPCLAKVGNAIGSRIDLIHEEIVSLKKRFPGRFTNEVHTDDILETLRDASRRLQRPDEEIQAKCKAGELGLELEETVKSLTQAIRTIKTQVEGEIPSYSRMDSALSLFRRLRSIGLLMSFMAKLFVLFFVAMILLFSYLFFTMEKVETLVTTIAQDGEIIRSQHKRLAELAIEKQTLTDKIQRMRRHDMGRHEKIVVLDLTVKVQDLEKKMATFREDIYTHEIRIRDSREKVEELKNKPFLKRVLRR